VVVIPFDDKVVSYSVNRGIPFMLDNNKNQPVGKCISQLAELVRERIAKLEQEALEKHKTLNCLEQFAGSEDRMSILKRIQGGRSSQNHPGFVRADPG
jgi:hypothetical protein